MMKRLLATMPILISVSLCLFSGSASAHVLKTDGSIGAVLHIQPDDNPTTGQPTTYVLAFNDENGKFNLAHCDCNVAILENGKSIYTHALQITDTADSVNQYTFQKPDVYTIRVSGKPNSSNTFQSFTLDYLVRVTGGAASARNEQQIPVLIWVTMAMGIGLLILAGYAMEIGYNNEQQNTTGG